jgi:hypothetical protein
MKGFSILFFLLLTIDCVSQTINIKGFIYNESKEPLVYTTIENVGKTKGVISDSLGRFSIDVKIGDTLFISCLGYHSQYIYSFEKTDLIIILKQQIQVLPDLVIRNNKKSKYFIGCKDDKPNKGGGFNINVGHIIVYHFKPEEKDINKTVESIEIYINDDGIKETPFRIRIFSKLNNSEFNDLLTENILIIPSKNDKWRSIDLSKLNIQIPANGIFIGLQYIIDKPEFYYDVLHDRRQSSINIKRYGNKITGTYESSQNLTWIKHLGGSWYQQNFNIDGKFLNLAIRAYLSK